MRSRFRAALALLALTAAACSSAGAPTGSGTGSPVVPRPDTGLPATARTALAATAGTPLIDPGELVSGAPFDAIRSVDEPVVADRAAADAALGGTEQVMLVQHGGQARAYPTRSLIRHEIVNDTVGGLPVAVTWCPLCNTGITFDRRVDGRPEVFGVSGLLYRSALVMFDRRTTSLWPQPLGRAALGELLGAELAVVPSALVSYDQARRAAPDLQVVLGGLSELDTSRNPYVGYDTSRRPFLYSGEVDDRVPAFERVVGLDLDADVRAYPYSLLRERRVVRTGVAGRDAVVLWAPGSSSPLDGPDVRAGRDVGSAGVFDRWLDGRALTLRPAGDDRFTDTETGSQWTVTGTAVAGPLTGAQLERLAHSDAFWFAWAAFHPETDVVRG